MPRQASQATRVGTRTGVLVPPKASAKSISTWIWTSAPVRVRVRPPRPVKSPNIWSKMSPKPPAPEKSKPPGPRALLERRVSVTVVGAALLVILENLVGLADFLEACFCRLVVRVAVGVVLHGELAVGLFQVLRVRVFRHFQGGVVICFGHHLPQGKAKGVVRSTLSRDAPGPRWGQSAPDPGASPLRQMGSGADWPQRGPGAEPLAFLPYADFFLFSSSSSNSASTTLSPPGAAPASGAAPAACSAL